METTSKRKSGTTDLTVGKPLFQIPSTSSSWALCRVPAWALASR